ncbi:MAG TPA: hypothetical protein VFH34_02250 [Anaerolineales bacterium]|nr:hypothetical protein [Anaerolineales bacterium]
MWINQDEGNMKLEGWPQIEINEHQTTMWMVFESLMGAGYFVRVGLHQSNGEGSAETCTGN